jgi:hypothetical protein
MDGDGEVPTLVCALRLEVFTESRESSSLRFFFFWEIIIMVRLTRETQGEVGLRMGKK